MELTSQVTTFVITIVTGVVLGVLFDFYRVLRGNYDPKTLLTWFTDLLYWFVATVVILVALVFSNWGELRFYVFLGIISGLGLYYTWLSNYAIRLFSNVIRLIVMMIKLVRTIIISVFVRPTGYCMRMVWWPFAFVYRKTAMWYHIRWPDVPEDEKK